MGAYITSFVGFGCCTHFSALPISFFEKKKKKKKDTVWAAAYAQSWSDGVQKFSRHGCGHGVQGEKERNDEDVGPAEVLVEH